MKNDGRIRAMSILILLSVMFLTGCDSYWKTEQIPLTSDELKCVQTNTVEILKNVSTKGNLSLSGFDQDWGDLVREANLAAQASCCELRMWEYNGRNHFKTGKWVAISQDK